MIDALHKMEFAANSEYADPPQIIATARPAYPSAENASLQFAIQNCALGLVLVAASQNGITAILLGDDRETLIADLERRFPKTPLMASDIGLDTVIAKVVRHIDNPATRLDVPLDIRGTAFQRRVWMALGEIPSGTTVTYSEIAARIGKPKAIRAVATACAANKIAVVIPCHRVVSRDGSLSGYRWGVGRKKALIDREAVSATL